jgi:hypothetical protein
MYLVELEILQKKDSRLEDSLQSEKIKFFYDLRKFPKVVESYSALKQKDSISERRYLMSGLYCNFQTSKAQFKQDSTILALQALNTIEPYKMFRMEYRKLFQEKLPYRSSFVAGALSTVVPGSGRIYTNNTRTGILNFLSISTFTWQAIHGFRRKQEKSIYGWICAGVGFSFYVGNIYGSAKGAKRFNNLKRNEAIKKRLIALY